MLRNLALLLLALSAVPSLAEPEPPALRIYVQRPGVYQVTYEALAAAGLKAAELDSAALQLTQQGRSVPLWLADGGDGRFGAGDHFEFVAEQLGGEGGLYYHEYSKFNVFRLSWAGGKTARMTPVRAAESRPDREGRPLRQRQHLEVDQLLIRLSQVEINQGDSPDVWFWAKLTHVDREPLRVPLAVPELDPAGEPVTLTLHFRSLSQVLPHQEGFADHEVQLSLNGQPLGSATWNGKTTHRFELSGLASRLWSAGENVLELRVPARTPPEATAPVVDVVMLDWIKLDFPRRQQLDLQPPARQQTSFELAPETSGRVRLAVPGASRLVVYGDQGSRVELAGDALSFKPAKGETRFHVVSGGQAYAPDLIEADLPADLRATFQRADYLIITPARLREAVNPLAMFYRSRGLKVSLIDVQDIYDEFNHGILHPQALRDFIAYAYHHWRPPAPRFVLLVGDASWDTKNATVDNANYANWTQLQLLDSDRFVAKENAVYARDPQLNQRNLIPTWTYHSVQGHSASDNFFVSVDGDDFLPDLAIGRLPVTEPEEVAAIVRKTLQYAVGAQVGPWRRRILWITNDEIGPQKRSDYSAALASERGYAAVKVYPRAEEENNAVHQEQLRDAFDQGQLLVHFFGHGGRYIWRTGPPDLSKNHDLFTLEDLDLLQPHARLPVVLSMTCFSAPFDHPNADSIGEKFLRLENRGAVAVVAASWRNSPSQAFSDDLVRELTAPGTTVGEALMRAKRLQTSRTLVEQYNLLGDPALPLALPQMAVQLDFRWIDPEQLEVSAQVPVAAFRGHALVEWMDSNGKAVASEQLQVTEPTFTARYSGPLRKLSRVRGVSVYVWNQVKNVDGLGHVTLTAYKSASPEDLALEASEASDH